MIVETAQEADIVEMVRLSSIKRNAYAKVQPVFWRKHPDANMNQERWFSKLLKDQQYITLVAKQSNQLEGFVIGHIIDAPDVYEPGGKTLFVDDFCVKSSWDETAQTLLTSLVESAKQNNCVQSLIVCGSHDEGKKDFLKSQYYSCINHWFHKEI